MSEAALLLLLSRYPQRVALARRVRGDALALGLERLERGGLVRRGRAGYQVTARGRSELELARLLGRVIVRSA